ncbi:MAG TPA: hypothetical protein VL326_14550 [Kofleriaceae bacterium]|nr:hypothetical protein [Kofleriaceae bacterium]
MFSDPDRYDAWYAEKLWGLLPAIYRADDSADFNQPGPLREMVERIAAQAAVVRRSIDRLWEDQSIETCDDWVIDYLGDLLATNLVASLDAPGRRLDVAKTINYRRRKGTVGLLEELATDITRWSVRVVEMFRRLGRTRHNLDPAIGMVALPRFTSTAHVGTSTGTLRLGGVPLDDHDVTVRIDTGGQAGTATWSVSIDGGGWRSQGASPMAAIVPAGGGTLEIALVDATAPSFVAGDTFAFSVSVDPHARLQRVLGLVGPLTRTGAGGIADLRSVQGAERSRSAFGEYFHTADVRRGRGKTGWYDIPRLGVFVWRLTSFAVHHVTPVADANCPNCYTFDPTGRDVPLFAAATQTTGDQWISPQEEQLPGPISAGLMRAALPSLYSLLVDGKVKRRSLALYLMTAPPSQVDPELVPVEQIAADPRGSSGLPWIDAERGRIVWPAAPTNGPFLVDYHYGFTSLIGAGPYDRRGTAAYTSSPPPSEHVHDTLAPLDAKLGTLRPTAVLEIDDSLTYDTVANLPHIQSVGLRAANKQRPLIRLPQGASWTLHGDLDAELTLDGLFISGGHVVLAGDFARVALSCCTLDPGTWDPKATPPAWKVSADGRPLGATELRVSGSIRELVIDRSIMGPIICVGSGRIEKLTIRESIVQAADPAARDAIKDTGGEVSMSRSTLLGTAKLHRLDASECILHDVVTVDDTQHGCIRFSAYAKTSTVPRQYESIAIEALWPLFVSTSFGRPEYGQLADTAGEAIAEGAEDGSEMGAFWRARNAIKERSLLIKYQEYLPLGLEPVIVHVT